MRSTCGSSVMEEMNGGAGLSGLRPAPEDPAAPLLRPREQLEFLDLLRKGLPRRYSSTPCGGQPVIQEAYEKLEKRNFFRRWCALLWGHFRHWAARRKRR